MKRRGNLLALIVSQMPVAPAYWGQVLSRGNLSKNSFQSRSAFPVRLCRERHKEGLSAMPTKEPNIVIEAANDNTAPLMSVIIPHDDEVLRPEIYRSLGAFVADLGLSRREFANWLQLALIDPRYAFIWQGSWARFRPRSSEVDKVFRDGGFRWISSFVKAAKNPAPVKRQRPQYRMRKRLRLIAIAMIARYPEKAFDLFKK